MQPFKYLPDSEKRVIESIFNTPEKPAKEEKQDDENMFWSLVKHYNRGKGRRFPIEEFPKTADYIKAVDITNVKAMNPFVAKKFTPQQVKIQNAYNRYGTRPLPEVPRDVMFQDGEDFEVGLSRIYEYLLRKELSRKKGEKHYLPLKQKEYFAFESMPGIPELSTNPRAFDKLGTMDYYVYGYLTLNMDGSWNFQGYKNLFDFWDFDSKIAQIDINRYTLSDYPEIILRDAATFGLESITTFQGLSQGVLEGDAFPVEFLQPIFFRNNGKIT